MKTKKIRVVCSVNKIQRAALLAINAPLVAFGISPVVPRWLIGIKVVYDD